MRRRSQTTASLAVLAAALTLAGCNKQPTASDDTATSTANEDASATGNVDTGTSDDGAVVAQESAAQPIEVDAVPAPAAAVPTAEAAPLADASSAARAIADSTGITRVQQDGGWAWMQDGYVIRTASSDGHRVSYFHHGDNTPYLVQDNGHTYAYAGGRVTHEYDEHGRVSAPDAAHRGEAQQLSDQAHQQHDRAQQARRSTDDRRGASDSHASTHGVDTRGGANDSPATPQPQAGNSDHGHQPAAQPTWRTSDSRDHSPIPYASDRHDDASLDGNTGGRQSSSTTSSNGQRGDTRGDRGYGNDRTPPS